MTSNIVTEIIDDNDELIGSDDIPHNGSDLESQANHTTDHNVAIGHQNYSYDMMARFGFALMPFMEGKEENPTNKVIKSNFDRYTNILKYYHKNPNKIHSDYRKMYDNGIDLHEKENIEWCDNIKNVLEPKKNIDEVAMVEDKLVDSKKYFDVNKKGKSNEIGEKKIEKVAELINKLNKNDVDKLINLLERK